MAGTGGYRPNAGRKAKKIKLLQKNFAQEVLDNHEKKIKPKGLWDEFLESTDLRIRLDATKYLNDHAHGKAKESVTVSGDEDNPVSITVKHVGSDN
jgi:hypothetical protein